MLLRLGSLTRGLQAATIATAYQPCSLGTNCGPPGLPLSYNRYFL